MRVKGLRCTFLSPLLGFGILGGFFECLLKELDHRCRKGEVYLGSDAVMSRVYQFRRLRLSLLKGVVEFWDKSSKVVKKYFRVRLYTGAIINLRDVAARWR